MSILICVNLLPNLLVKSLGIMRPDQTDSLLPAKRMPMGLIEHCVNFFSVTSINQISCPPDYRSWLQTMYVLFGTKWCKIFTGPLWSHVSVEQTTTAILHSRSTNPIEALVNVPALSERTLRRDIASSDFTTGSEIQTSVLKKLAATINPNARWWIKGDGTDIVKGLWESVSGEWSGDVDLNDRKLNQLYKEFKDRLAWVKCMAIGDIPPEQIKKHLTMALEDNSADLAFVTSELHTANKSYEERLTAGHTSEQSMFSISWDIEELKSLHSELRKMHQELTCCVNACDHGLFQEQNIPRKLTKIRSTLCELIRLMAHFRRNPATHIFVLMISCDVRDKKPYALPVQCLLYASLKEIEVRRLVFSLSKEVVTLGIKVSGFASDGEFNYLRAKGYTRPLSVLQIRCIVCNKYSKMSIHRMLAMITPKQQLPDGTITTESDCQIVPQHILLDITNWRRQGLCIRDIVDRLRPRTVLPGHNYHTWIKGKAEGFEDKLRSLLAQFHYTSEIRKFEAEEIAFNMYMYVPECHPETHDIFFEREDEAHLIKCIASHTTNGGPAKIKLERYTEAIRGGCRTSKLAAFMKRKGYDYEARYITAVWNWRRASDERGLSSLLRCKYNYQFLQMILTDLMPWHSETYDFGLLEVNRSLSNVLGFSKETLVAVITNIDGREWHRWKCANKNQPLEHPRASSTDDVECFFSLIRDSIGQNFTVKEAKFGMRKIVGEFSKRADPELPLYYHTSSYTRYYEGPHPEFDKAPERKIKEQRVPRREQPSAFVPRHATMPVRGTLSVRPTFHNLPLELPPPPDGPVFLFEHSYAQNPGVK